MVLTNLGIELDRLRDCIHHIRGMAENGDDVDMAAIDDLRTAVQTLRDKITAVVARLSDNPTAAEVTSATSDLDALGTQLDAIDPDVAGGPVEPGTEITPPA